MIRSLLVASLLVTGCGDNDHPPIDYTNPPAGGALRLIKTAALTTGVVLDLVVGDQPLIGYAVGFDLPIAPRTIRLGKFTPGVVLDAGPEPIAARGLIPNVGPLANMLVTAQSQKANAIATDTVLPAGAVLYTIQLDLDGAAANGVVFDGTAADFVLPSGGLRNRAGTTVVEAKDVSIGKLSINR